MDYRILKEETSYTGKELRSGWVRDRTGLAGDAAAAFVGPCRVDNADLVDLDDARAGAFIASASMAHIIIEHPGCNLEVGVLRQRLLVGLLVEVLRDNGCDARRDGDDVYHDGRKLTVSIAAPSPESCVIHLGINVRPDGAPVPAVGLDDIGIGAEVVLAELLARYRSELASCDHAEHKVRSVP